MVSDVSQAAAPGVPPVPGKWRAAALYAVLTLLLTYPISAHPGQRLLSDDPDAHLGMWMLAWDVHAFTHQPFSIFDANTFYPQLRTLAYQDNLIGSALLVAPLLWLTGNPVLAMNGVSLLACVLCGLGAYVLARRVGLSEAASLLCGLIFAFCPARLFRFPQVGLAPVQWIPLTLASLHAYFDGGRKRDLRLAVGFFTLQTLTSGHAAVFLVVAIVTLLTYRLALGEPIRPGRRISDLGLTGVLLLLPAALVYLPYHMNQVQVGLRRGLGSWGTAPESFLASPTHLHMYLMSLVGMSTVNELASGFLFPGYLPLFLAVVAVMGLTATRIRSEQTLWSRVSLVRILQVVLVAGVGLAGISALRLLRLQAATSPLPLSQTLWALLACGALGVGLLVVFRAEGTGAMQRDRRALIMLVPAVAGLGVLFAARSALPAANGLVAWYYTNAQWADQPAMTIVDARPSSAAMTARWGGAPPQVSSVAWTGFLTVGRSGLYHFATTSDDGSWLYIDNQLVVDNGGAHGPETRSGQIQLDRGAHRIRLRYAQLGGGYALDWSWAPEGGTHQAVPGWRLSQGRTSYSAAVAARAIDWTAWICAAVAVLVAVWWLSVSLRPAWRSWGQWAAAARANPVPLYLALTLLCVGLAVGPPYSLWPYVYRWPGFSFIRAPLRFMVLGSLGVAVLGGVGFDRITTRIPRARRRMAAVAMGTVMVVEFAAMPLISVPVDFTIPAADQWVARQPKPFVVAEVPVGPERYQSLYMLHSMAHWQKTVAGYGGIRPILSQVLNGELQGFPDVPSLQRLTEIGVTYVIVHVDFYERAAWTQAEERLRSFEDSWLTLEYSDRAARVYSLRGMKASNLR